MKPLWHARATPLEPTAVFAGDLIARKLILRLLQKEDDQLRAYRGVAGKGMTVILGEDLPWLDGVVYLGRDPRARSLLLPIHRYPRPSPELLEQAVAARGLKPPVAVFPKEQLLLSVADARPLAAPFLRAFLEQDT